MKLGTEMGLDAGHIVLDGNPAPLKRGTAPNFRPMSVVAKRLDVSIIVFTDENVFTVNTPKNIQNDRLYAHPSTKRLFNQLTFIVTDDISRRVTSG